jgi:hypothetical protein
MEGFIYIKVCDVGFYGTRVVLMNECNEVVFRGIIDAFGVVKVPVCDKGVYSLFIYSGLRMIAVPLIARVGMVYCVNVGVDVDRNHLITVMLVDANSPDVKIKRGEIVLWQDIQFQ